MDVYRRFWLWLTTKKHSMAFLRTRATWYYNTRFARPSRYTRGSDLSCYEQVENHLIVLMALPTGLYWHKKASHSQLPLWSSSVSGDQKLESTWCWSWSWCGKGCVALFICLAGTNGTDGTLADYLRTPYGWNYSLLRRHKRAASIINS